MSSVGAGPGRAWPRVAAPGAGALLALAVAGCGGLTLLEPTGGGGPGGAGSGGDGGAGGATTPCGCAADADCPAGLVCEACACVPECATSADCPAPLACCGGACTDIEGDTQSCGACGATCEHPNATSACAGGVCVLGACDTGFLDCDGDPANGCETMGVSCLCAVGATLACYTGPGGTEGVGLCAAGTQSCIGGTMWGPCEGEIVPSQDVCNGLDDDCDGAPDNDDPDGDGWTACDGDCCEDTDCAGSLDPAWINPGAMEYPANVTDDDCDPATPDDAPYPTCGGPALDVPTTSLELLNAMDLCRVTAEDPPAAKDRTWGVISAALTLADGSPLPADVQAGVLSEYGAVLPAYGPTMAALSSGTARDEADPGFVHPQNGYVPGQIGSFSAGTIVPVPADFLGPGGAVPPGCGACDGPACATAHDSISLRVRIRTPTNAKGLHFRSRLYTAEYPESVCSEFNDFFVALLTSRHPDTPANRNIAVDPYGNDMSVNAAALEVCGYPGCAGGSLDLLGTGMGGWDGTLLDGAGTLWADSVAPIVPGETIEIQFAIWDAYDSKVDSTVLIDRFRWKHILDGGLPPPHP